MSTQLHTKLKNMTTGKKIIGDILKKYKANEIVEDIDILTLLRYHPTKHIQTENIEYLTLKIRPPYNTLSLYYKYKDNDIVDDISYVMCIKNMFGKYTRDKTYEEDVKNAFRNESHVGKKKQFFIDNTVGEGDTFFGVCAHCNKRTEKIAVDHYEAPFKQILGEFLIKESIQILDTEVFENEKHEMRLRDTKLAKRWLEFHDSKAKFRILCKSCNSHFGAYGV
jgi:hypothetical protein